MTNFQEFDYSKGIIYQYYKNIETNECIAKSKVETQTVHPNKHIIQLSEEPSEAYRVYITNNGVGMSEVRNYSDIENKNQFYVDYDSGNVYFHSSLGSPDLKIEYMSIGGHLIHYGKIYTKTDAEGNVVETLKDMIDEGTSALVVLRKFGGADKVVEGLTDLIKQSNDNITKINSLLPELKSENIKATNNIKDLNDINNSVNLNKDIALSAIETASNNAISGISSAHSNAIRFIEQAEQDALDEIEKSRNKTSLDISIAKRDALDKITSSANTSETNIALKEISVLQSIEDKEEEAITEISSSVSTEKEKSLKSISDATDEAIKLIKASGGDTETINKMKQDISGLSWVGNYKSMICGTKDVKTTSDTAGTPLANLFTQYDKVKDMFQTNGGSTAFAKAGTFLVNLGKVIYPVGSILMTATDSNPSAIWGGTWVNVAKGEVIAGVGNVKDRNGVTKGYTAGDNTNLEHEHTLTVSELPSHYHEILTASMSTMGEYESLSSRAIEMGEEVADRLIRTQTAGMSYPSSFRLSPPAYGVYVWKRTVL